MRIEQARAAARQWVAEEGSTLPGFRGAFFHGSIGWLPDDAALPETSDVDVLVVLADGEPPEKVGKFRYRGLLLEVSFLSCDDLRSPEAVLGQYHLAGSFRTASVISDPTGSFTELQRAVAKDFAKREWVYRRCEDAHVRVLHNLRSLKPDDPLHDQVTAWLFATGVTTHILLVAGLRNPTVRRRYEATRDLLIAYGRPDFYEALLALLGADQVTKARAAAHLEVLAAAFDAASAVVKTPFFFAADLSEAARPIAIDGSQEMIAACNQREAIFWMVATYARCLKVLAHDAPEAAYRQHEVGFRRLLADLGISSPADLVRRGADVEAFLPAVWAVAEAIIASNPEIEGA